MGHKTTQGTGKRYWHPSAGCLYSNCKEQVEGAEPYTPKKGKYAGQQRWRQKSYGYEGLITSVSVNDSDFGGKNLEITFDNNTVITTDASGSYMTRFANVCQQIDVLSPVEVTPWSMPSDKNPDKPFVGWTWRQFSKKLTPPQELNPSLPDFCTLPQPRDVTINGKKMKDWSARDAVLLGIVEDWATSIGIWTNGAQPPAAESEEPGPEDQEPEEKVY